MSDALLAEALAVILWADSEISAIRSGRRASVAHETDEWVAEARRAQEKIQAHLATQRADQPDGQT